MADDTIEPNAHARDRVRDDLIGWFTTVRPNGQPDCVPVWFVWTDDERILIYSRPSKQKLRNLEQNPKVALALDDTKGGDDVVRFEGVAAYVPDHPRAHEVPAFVAKYDDHCRRLGYGGSEEFGRDFSAAVVVTPTRLRSWR